MASIKLNGNTVEIEDGAFVYCADGAKTKDGSYFKEWNEIDPLAQAKAHEIAAKMEALAQEAVELIAQQ